MSDFERSAKERILNPVIREGIFVTRPVWKGKLFPRGWGVWGMGGMGDGGWGKRAKEGEEMSNQKVDILVPLQV